MEIKNFYIKEKIFNIENNKIHLDRFLKSNDYSEEDVINYSGSIKKFGITHPVYVRKDIKNPNKYLCFDNPLYLLALKFLNVSKIPVIIFSYTLPEAVIYFLLNNSNLNIFKRAELFKFLLKEGNFNVKEICDIFKISPSLLDLYLLPLILNSEEKRIAQFKNFSLNFIKIYSTLNCEQKEKTLNYVVSNNLNEIDTINYIKQFFAEEKKPIKAFCLTNDTIILNSLEKIKSNLENIGIKSTVTKKEKKDFAEYILKINNNPNQVIFDFLNIS